jgi:hypothetical protein
MATLASIKNAKKYFFIIEVLGLSCKNNPFYILYNAVPQYFINSFSTNVRIIVICANFHIKILTDFLFDLYLSN